MFAGPVNLHVLADVQQEIQFVREERVVVLAIETEEREGFAEGTATDDDFRAAQRQEVEGGEVLEDPHGIFGAEHGDGAGEADAAGS